MTIVPTGRISRSVVPVRGFPDATSVNYRSALLGIVSFPLSPPPNPHTLTPSSPPPCLTRYNIYQFLSFALVRFWAALCLSGAYLASDPPSDSFARSLCGARGEPGDTTKRESRSGERRHDRDTERFRIGKERDGTRTVPWDTSLWRTAGAPRDTQDLNVLLGPPTGSRRLEIVIAEQLAGSTRESGE